MLIICERRAAERRTRKKTEKREQDGRLNVEVRKSVFPRAHAERGHEETVFWFFDGRV
jgi:hypothetical protein